MSTSRSTAPFWENVWGIGAIVLLHSVSWPSARAAGFMALCLLVIGLFCGRTQAWLDETQ